MKAPERSVVLDHGYVECIESWGSDARIVETARMSTDGAFRGWGPTCVECGWAKGEDHEAGCSRPEKWKPGDEKLLRYLYEHKHSTPFEFAGLIIEVQAPIFVFREWHRHRTQSYSEISARYTPLPDLYYVPTLERVMADAAGPNKQASRAAGASVLVPTDAERFINELKHGYDVCETIYKHFLTAGVPKELARAIMPVGHYSRMRATANLRNWLAFLTLRMDNTAQWEIRQFANVVGTHVAARYPRTWELFNEKGRT
jgi:thymidylate synthase (FAD)